MAQKLDAAGRLTEGMPAVDNVAAYVWACRAVGYQNADLTLHAAQVHDWYATEEGLDLRALDADCTALQAAATAAQDAVARHVEQVGELAAVWQGRGAEASREFLRGHGDAAANAAEAVSSAAGALADLRDALWRAVDAKVVAAQTIDDRVQARRADWLAAAQTVSTGVGDRAVASELIDQQVKPFVDNDIRSEWVSAMRAAMAAAMDAYDAATAELTSTPDAMFEVPQDLGPSWTPPAAAEVAAPAANVPASAVSVLPPAWNAAPAAAPMWSAPATAPPVAPAAPAAVGPAAGAAPPTEAPAPTPAPAPSLGGMGGGMPDIGGGLSGLGQQLADTLGGLLGSSGDALDDLPDGDEPGELDEQEDIEELDDEETAEDLDEKEAADDEEAPEDAEPMATDPQLECQPPEEEPPAEPLAEPVPQAEEEPAPTAAPPPPPEPIQPVPPPSPMSAETPCEIAADELPQVGE